jgi:integrase
MRTNTGPRWYKSKQAYFVMINGKRFNLGSDRTTAEAEYLRLKQAASSEVLGDRQAIANLLAKYLDEVEATKRATTYNLWRRILTPFVAAEGNRPVNELTPAHVTAFIAAMRKPRQHAKQKGRTCKWGQGTARILITALRAAFRWARRQGLISRNPIDLMQGIEAGIRDDSCLVTAEQHALLVSPAYPALADILTALWHTGARPSALINATATDLRGDQIVLVRRPGAKVKKVVVYLNAAMQAMVAGRQGHLFRNEDGKPWTLETLQRTLLRLRRRCGCHHVFLYSYRHAFAHRALAAGVPIADLAQLMSTSVAQIERTYGHLARHTDRLRASLAMIA